MRPPTPLNCCFRLSLKKMGPLRERRKKMILVLLSTSVESISVSRMRHFFFFNHPCNLSNIKLYTVFLDFKLREEEKSQFSEAY